MSSTDVKTLTSGQRRLRLSTGRVIAEAGSIATSFGAIYAAEKLAPHQLADFKNYVAKRIVKPNLPAFESLADALPTLEGEEGQEERRQMTPDEKAKKFANVLVDFSIMAAAGIVGQTAIQKLCNEQLFKLGKPDKITGKLMLASCADKAIHLGSIGVMNTMAIQPTQHLQDAVAQHVMKNIGVKGDDVAMSRAKYLVNWQLPNMIGMLGSLLLQDRFYTQHNNR